MDRNDAARLARQLMNEHGLDQWVFQFDNAKRRFGVCRHTAHVIGLSASAKGAACPRCCHGGFDPRFRLVWTRSTRKGASCPV